MEIKLITYINLESRKVRKTLMETQLLKQKLPYFRTPGVSCENFGSYRIVPNIEAGSARHKGTVGCFLAHRDALSALIDKNLEENDACLVLEDDVLIHDHFWRALDELEFPDEAEILFFNATMQYPGKPHPPKNQKGIYLIDRGHPMFSGAFSYIMKKSTIRVAIEKMETVETYGDVDSDFYYKNFVCYTVLTRSLSLRRFISDRHPEAEFNAGRSSG